MMEWLKNIFGSRKKDSVQISNRTSTDSNPTQLYSALKPGERIEKLMVEFLSPTLEKNGFKFLKSRREFRKKTDFFEFYVWWRGGKFNSGNSVVYFDVGLLVSSKKYRKWQSDFYKLDKTNYNAITGSSVEYIENWNKDYYHHMSYDLVKYDNRKVMEAIQKNLEGPGTDFFNQFSTLESAISYLARNPIKHFTTIIDFHIYQNQIAQAKAFFNEHRSWFEEQEKLAGHDPESQYSLNHRKSYELRKNILYPQNSTRKDQIL